MEGDRTVRVTDMSATGSPSKRAAEDAALPVAKRANTGTLDTIRTATLQLVERAFCDAEELEQL